MDVWVWSWGVGVTRAQGVEPRWSRSSRTSRGRGWGRGRLGGDRGGSHNAGLGDRPKKGNHHAGRVFGRWNPYGSSYLQSPAPPPSTAAPATPCRHHLHSNTVHVSKQQQPHGNHKVRLYSTLSSCSPHPPPPPSCRRRHVAVIGDCPPCLLWEDPAITLQMANYCAGIGSCLIHTHDAATYPQPPVCRLPWIRSNFSSRNGWYRSSGVRYWLLSPMMDILVLASFSLFCFLCMVTGDFYWWSYPVCYIAVSSPHPYLTVYQS